MQDFVHQPYPWLSGTGGALDPAVVVLVIPGAGEGFRVEGLGFRGLGFRV